MPIRLTIDLYLDARRRIHAGQEIAGDQLRLGRPVIDSGLGPLTVYAGNFALGSISPTDRRRVAPLTDSGEGVTVALLTQSIEKIYIEIDSVGKINSTCEIECVGIESVAGIYEITFSTSSGKRYYIGQSTNIKKRINTHQSELIAGRHHNNELQDAWRRSPNSFIAMTLLTMTPRLAGLALQKQLHEKERYYIELRGYECVNAIEADISLTVSARSEINQLMSVLDRDVKKIKTVESHLKKSLGQLFIDLGLIKTEIPRNVSGVISSTNVLTWIERRLSSHSYNNLWAPSIEFSNVLYKPIVSALKEVNSRIKTMEAEVRSAKLSLESQQGGYGGAKANHAVLKNIENMVTKYAAIARNMPALSEFRKVKGRRVDYDSSVARELARNVIDQL